MSSKSSSKSQKKTETSNLSGTCNHIQQVIVEELDAEQGKIGLLKLNSEETLNSLTFNMVQILSTKLTEWASNDDIAVVILMASGDKAFCAGGDIQALYESVTNQVDGECVDAEHFFFHEYQLNYQIHCYDKPIICIGNGFVMGGGLGLMAGASHRVVTETTRLAMPEVTIGLFPDVGSTVFLNQVPHNLGYFLALTGIAINAVDTIFCRLADYAIEWKNCRTLIEKLQSESWGQDDEKNHLVVDQQLRKLTPDSSVLRPSDILPNLTVLEETCRHNSLCQIIDAIDSFDTDNPWLSKAKNTLQAGSPLATLMIYEQLKRNRYADLQTAFSTELVLATNMARYPEFAEGIRALLIDKDKSPKWAFEHFSHVPCSLVEQLFSAPWSQNPLTGKLI